MKKLFQVYFVLGFIILGFGFWGFVNSSAETLNEVKDMKNQIDNKINELEALKKQQKDSLNSASQDKNKLTQEQNKIDVEKNKLQGQKTNQETKLLTIEDSLKDAEKSYKTSLNAFKSRVRSIYQNSNKTNLDVLVNSENLVELSGKIFVLNSVAEKNNEIIKNFKSAKTDLEYKRSVNQMNLTKLRKDLDLTNSKLQTVKQNQNTIDSKIIDINQKLKKIEMEEDEMEEESRKLAKKIRLFAKTGRKYIGGKLFWPVPSSSEITSPFGRRFHPVLKYERFHSGIDIAGGMGSNIVAANDGTVVFSGYQGGYGNVMIVDHGGGIMTLYGHCSSLLANEGQKVSGNDIIARVGSTGISTGPHLHFEVRVNGEPTDPMNYLGK